MNSDLERLLKIYWEMTHIQYNQALDPLGKEFKKLKAKLEQDLEKAELLDNIADSSVTQYEIKITKEIESLKDTIEDFHRESKHSAEALSTLKQDLQVKVLEIGLLKEENNRRFGGIKLLEEARKEIKRLETIVLTQHEVFQVQEQKLERIKKFTKTMPEDYTTRELKAILKSHNCDSLKCEQEES